MRDENKVMLVKTAVDYKGLYKRIIITTIIIAPFSTPALIEKLFSLL